MNTADLNSTRPAHPQHTPLSGLGADLSQAVGTTGDPLISGVTLSSQRVLPGDLYAALPGARVHGAQFAAQAVAAGAVAVLTDAAGAALAGGIGVPVLVAEQPRNVLGEIAATIYGRPTEAMRMIGVTGTQGKTTTTRLVELALSGCGVRAGVVGTVGTRIAGADVATALTTPEAPDLQALFARMVEQEVSTCAMEVSSHALVLRRVDGICFDIAVFTNLGRDHLDFHADVEEYFAAKAELFTPARTRRALVNIEDEHGRRLLAEAQVPTLSFSIDGRDADWQAVDLDAGAAGTAFTVRGPNGVNVRTFVPIPGDFNVANALAGLAAAIEVGHDADRLGAALAAAGGVPGRLERVAVEADYEVVVDYAHKPDAIEAALRTLRPLASGRLILVIGAGGDRDRGKRPLMGEISARLADVVVVTDDNPRTEDPAAIRAEVLAGATGGRAEVREIGDRRAAIRAALDLAAAGDIVVVAGKGHETGQEINGVVHPFDDRLVVVEEARR